jgi:hypothetical protein
MSNLINYQTEFYLMLDKKCQDIIDSLYEIISRLNYYEHQCGFELATHFKKLRSKIIEMLKSYDSQEEETQS